MSIPLYPPPHFPYFPPSSIVGCYGGGSSFSTARSIALLSLPSSLLPETLISNLLQALEQAYDNRESFSSFAIPVFPPSFSLPSPADLTVHYTFHLSSHVYDSFSPAYNILPHGFVFRSLSEEQLSDPEFHGASLTPLLGLFNFHNIQIDALDENSSWIGLNQLKPSDVHIHKIENSNHSQWHFGSDCAKFLVHNPTDFSYALLVVFYPFKGKFHMEIQELFIIPTPLEDKIQQILDKQLATPINQSSIPLSNLSSFFTCLISDYSCLSSCLTPLITRLSSFAPLKQWKDFDWYFTRPEFYYLIFEEDAEKESKTIERLWRSFVRPTSASSDRGIFIEPACGSARISRYLASRGHYCYGFDISLSAIELAREKANKELIPKQLLNLFEGEFQTFEIEQKSQQTIEFAHLLVSTLAHIPNDEGVISHIIRVLQVMRQFAVYAISLELACYDETGEIQSRHTANSEQIKIKATVVEYPPDSIARQQKMRIRVKSHSIMTGEVEYYQCEFLIRTYDLEQFLCLMNELCLSEGGKQLGVHLLQAFDFELLVDFLDHHNAHIDCIEPGLELPVFPFDLGVHHWSNESSERQKRLQQLLQVEEFRNLRTILVLLQRTK
jgi:SAM-dependent methyltransferase